MVKDSAGRPIDRNIVKLVEHFEYASEFPGALSDRTDLRETADAIQDMIPYLTRDETGSVIRTMLIISHETAAGPRKKGYARQILEVLMDAYPDIYQRVKAYHGY